MKIEAPVHKQDDEFCDKEYSENRQEKDEDEDSDEESTNA
jgi:hypothetical protein